MSVINEILRSLDREIWLITAAHENQRGGLIATFVSNASIVPEMPRVVVGIAKQHHSWRVIEASGEWVRRCGAWRVSAADQRRLH